MLASNRSNKGRTASAKVVVTLLIASVWAAGQTPVGTSITFQGQLKHNSQVVNDTCDFDFSLFDASTIGQQIGATLAFDGIGSNPAPIAVSNGLFTVQLDFGAGAFNGQERWLEIAVACPSGGAFTPLGSRQKITPSPYAIHALTAPAGHSLDAADGDPVDAVSVDAEGNVGVGTVNPMALLDVNGFSRTETLHVTGGIPLGETGGAVLGWGSDGSGETDVPAGMFKAIAAGGTHGLAIRTDGTLVGWGRNADGEIDVPSGTFVAVAAGGRHSLGLRTDGTLAAWGAGDFGLNNVPSGTFIAIGAGSSHNLAIRDDGTLVGWGNNVDGQTTVPSGTFIAVAGGNTHSIGLRTEGTIAAWGSNTFGQTNAPTGTFKIIAAGGLHNLAIRDDGTLAGWGSNAGGQIDVPAGTFTAVAANGAHSLGVRTDGTLAGWGVNTDGQIDVPTGNHFTAVAAGATFSLAIEIDPTAVNFGLQLDSDSAAKPGTNTWTIFSDRRLKKNIEPIQNALERMLRLQGVSFEWRDAAFAGGHRGRQMGMISDQVQKVFPDWVGTDPRGYKTLTIGGFEGLTAEAMRTLRAEKDAQFDQRDATIKELRADLSRKSSELTDLKARVNELEKLVETMGASASRDID